MFFDHFEGFSLITGNFSNRGVLDDDFHPVDPQGG